MTAANHSIRAAVTLRPGDVLLGTPPGMRDQITKDAAVQTVHAAEPGKVKITLDTEQEITIRDTTLFAVERRP